jgi:hypothetical protein
LVAPRHDQPAPTHLVEQRRGDCGGAGGSERDREQPRPDPLPAGGGEVAEAVGRAQRIQLLVARLSAGAIGGERRRLRADLVGDEAQRRLGDRLAHPQQSAGIAEGAELQREAEPVVVAAPPVDGDEVGLIQGPVADEVGFGDGQSE